MQDDTAFRSQEFAAQRSQEANAYRLKQADYMQQGLGSLVPQFQQARMAQTKQMQAEQEIAFGELQRQEALQTLQYTQELHRTKMMRAATDEALARAQLSIAQSKAAMEKLETEGYQKIPLLSGEQMEGIIAGGWKVVPGGARGLGRVEPATPEERAAAQKSIAARQELEHKRKMEVAGTTRSTENALDAYMVEQMKKKAGQGAAAPTAAAETPAPKPADPEMIRQRVVADLPNLIDGIALAVPGNGAADMGAVRPEWHTVRSLSPRQRDYLQSLFRADIEKHLPELIKQFAGDERAEQRLRSHIEERLRAFASNPSNVMRLLWDAPK